MFELTREFWPDYLTKTTKLAIKCDMKNSRDLNVKIGLIMLISTQKVLKTLNKQGSN